MKKYKDQILLIRDKINEIKVYEPTDICSLNNLKRDVEKALELLEINNAYFFHKGYENHRLLSEKEIQFSEN